MTHDDLCELFGDCRCRGVYRTIGYEDDTVEETVTIWYEGKRYRAEAQRMEPVPAHKRGTYVTEYGHTIWDETDKRIISAPTLKQLIRKLTVEGEYHL